MSRGSSRSWWKRGRANEPEVLGSVLDALAAGRPWAAGIALGELGRRWEGVVGERLAMECAPAGLEAGVLVIRASSAAWGAQIRFLESEIRDRANAALASEAVRGVRVTVGEGSGRG